MRTLIALCAAVSLAAALLAGCAQNKAIWQKPGVSAAQRERDAAECKYEADKAFAGAPRGCILCEVGSSGDIVVDAVAGKPSDRLLDQCMALRGYRSEAGR